MEPTGKRFLLAIDVSASMNQRVLGSVLNASTVAAAMCMVRTPKTIKNFSHPKKCLMWDKTIKLDMIKDYVFTCFCHFALFSTFYFN